MKHLEVGPINHTVRLPASHAGLPHQLGPGAEVLLTLDLTAWHVAHHDQCAGQDHHGDRCKGATPVPACGLTRAFGVRGSWARLACAGVGRARWERKKWREGCERNCREVRVFSDQNRKQWDSSSRSFARSLARSFVRSLGRSVVRSFVRLFGHVEKRLEFSDAVELLKFESKRAISAQPPHLWKLPQCVQQVWVVFLLSNTSRPRFKTCQECRREVLELQIDQSRP